ncbi:MAG: choice-of-anchor Q domain-containing protein [Phycisphaerales bacterium]
MLGLVMVLVCSSTVKADDFSYDADNFAIYAGGNITLRERTTVTGNVGAGGWLTIREDATYKGGNIFAANWITIRERTTVDGVVLAGGNITLRQDTNIVGDMQAIGRMTIYERAHARSDLWATDSITLRDRAIVDGDVHEHASLPHTWSAPTVTRPTFAPGTTDVTVNNRQTQTLAPGQYGVLRLRSGSKLRLSAGSYHFSAVQIDQDVEFEVDDSNGPVELYVNNHFTTRERFEVDVESDEATGFTLWASGGVSIREDCEFTGNIRSFANVSLRERMDFVGTIYAAGYFTGRENSTFKAASPPPVFYVRTRGSDASDGRSPATAFRTIQRGVQSCTVPGSIVYVGSGVYQESVVIGSGAGEDAVSGTEAKPIRLIADTTGVYTNDDPGEVVVDGRSTNDIGFDVSSRVNWVFDGFHLENQRKYGLRAASSGVSVLNCSIDVPANYGIYITAKGDVSIADCQFPRESDSMHSMWIQPTNTESTIAVAITRNDLTLKGADYRSTGLEAGWSSLAQRSWQTRYTYGIVIFGWGSTRGVDVEISNNQVSDSYLPIYSGIYNSSDSTMLVANNTVSGSFYSVYLYAYRAGAAQAVNNLIDTCYFGLLSYGYGSPTPVVSGTLENNITYTMARYHRPFELDIITGDPGFVDAPGGDFSLAGGSPGIDAGTNQGAPAVDFEGSSRPTDGDGDGIAVADIGAYEKINRPSKVRVVRWREIGAEYNR